VGPPFIFYGALYGLEPKKRFAGSGGGGLLGSMFGLGTRQEPVEKDVLIRLDRIEAEQRLLRAEMTDWLDKVSRFFARHRKRERDALRETIEEEATPHTGNLPDLTPAGVLARRGRRINGLHP
jgi:hypothetical protein